jgi:hypothetical protein
MKILSILIIYICEQTVFELMQELGGAATVSEISRLAREKYPNLSLWSYGDRFRKLKKWGLYKL